MAEAARVSGRLSHAGRNGGGRDGGMVHRMRHSGATSEVWCGDALEYLGRLRAGTAKLVVTSPPYNLGKEYEKRRRLDEYVEGQRRVIGRCAELLSDGGSICWQVGNYVDGGRIVPLDIALYRIFDELGLHMRNRIVWRFGHGLHCSRRLSGRYETIMWFTRPGAYTFNLDPIRVPSKYPGKRYFRGPRKGELSCNPLGKNPSDVWDIPNVKHNHVEKTGHPAQFPVELVERLVLSLTDRGDTVVDPYMGSGSTAVAALMHGRNSRGAERERRYVEIAARRLESLRAGTLRTRPMNTPIYEAPRGGRAPAGGGGRRAGVAGADQAGRSRGIDQYA